MTEEEGQRAPDEEQLSIIEGLVRYNPYVDASLCLFSGMDFNMMPNDVTKAFKNGTLEVGVLGGQHMVLAKRRILESSPEVFHELVNPTADGRVYVWGCLKLVNDYYVEKANMDPPEAHQNELTGYKTFTDPNAAYAYLRGVIGPAWDTLTPEEKLLIPTPVDAIFILRLEHNEVAGIQKKETWQQMMRSKEC